MWSELLVGTFFGSCWLDPVPFSPVWFIVVALSWFHFQRHWDHDINVFGFWKLLEDRMRKSLLSWILGKWILGKIGWYPGMLRLNPLVFSTSTLSLNLCNPMALCIAKNTPKYVCSGNSQLQGNFAGHLPV